MSIRIVKLNKMARVPERATDASVGYDVWILPNNLGDEPEDTFAIESGAVRLAKTGLIVIPPFGFHFELVLRSSVPLKNNGVTLANNIGIIDPDYIGEEDELRVMLYNPSKNIVLLDTTKPVAQLLLRQNSLTNVEEIAIEELRAFGKDSRGGFGSTDASKKVNSINFTPEKVKFWF